MSRRLTAVFCLAALSAAQVFAQQETRSEVFGRVLDPQGAAIAGASVVLRNNVTGVSSTFKSNDTGYYEANLLLPGEYSMDAAAPGFKHLSQKGVRLSVSSRLNVDLKMELGGVTETITVTTETPLLETNAVSSGRVIDNQTLMELPVMGNSAMTLVRLTPGIQTGGVNNYLALHSNLGGSDYNVDGNVGGNSWQLDGSPNAGPSRRAAYLPYTDGVAEFKVETNNFDAAIGKTTGAAITMISKSGGNIIHGTMTWQHWQQRWQGTPFFVKQQYFRNIAAADAAGNTTLAAKLRNTDKQPTGRSNNWGVSLGGPAVIPKVFNGRNKLFWFFTYNAFKDIKNEDPSTFNRTVPTAAQRTGDFSALLGLPNNAQYVVYDPITVTTDAARAGHFIRTPFTGNLIPKSRFANPAYDAITKLFPLPNNDPGPGQQPVNNYLASKTPYNWDYKAYSNRVDYQISDKWRTFGRWSFNNFSPEDRGDWTYETARGLNVGGLVRNNIGGNMDIVYVQNSTTIWDFNIGLNQFREGNVQPAALAYKPSDIGLPAYLDQKAGDLHILPYMNIGVTGSTNNGYSQISPGGYSTFTRYREGTLLAKVTKILGKHTINAAFDNRLDFRTGGGGGNTSGTFNFSTTFVRKDDDGASPNSSVGLAWAAFALGVPNAINVQTNDTYALLTPYYAGFVQDNWRITTKLTLNLGLRAEYEGGATERYNRMIGTFDKTLTLPIAAAAQAAYAAAPVPELAASQFQVVGGTIYPGSFGAPRNLIQGQLNWLPRFGAAYQVNSKTVIRGGYGIYFDTNSVLNFGPDQSGYSRQTNTNIADTGGVNFLFPANANPANGKSPLVDPFPVRSDGTRFDVPIGNALGTLARIGTSYGFTDYNQEHARQQRWRVAVQRQIGRDWVLDVAYSGSFADKIGIGHNLNILPQQFWGTGRQRADAIQTNLNGNVTNPFLLKNFASLQQSAPLVYQNISTNSFFTNTTIQKQRLLRAFPEMSGLTDNTTPVGKANTHGLELNINKRFSKGFNLNFGYSALKSREANFFYNEFDADPTYRTSNNGRPQRIVGSGIFEVPVGKGKRYLGNSNKVMDLLVGGWQFAATYEWQPGQLLDWGNVFYYGSDSTNILNVNRTWDTWFNTADFEKNSSKTPNGYNLRTFPTRLADLRADSTNQWNANASKSLHILTGEHPLTMQLRLDVLNVQNRSQMAAPSTDPTSTNFGKITSQTAATNRWLQVQARIQF